MFLLGDMAVCIETEDEASSVLVNLSTRCTCVAPPGHGVHRDLTVKWNVKC